MGAIDAGFAGESAALNAAAGAALRAPTDPELEVDPGDAGGAPAAAATGSTANLPSAFHLDTTFISDIFDSIKPGSNPITLQGYLDLMNDLLWSVQTMFYSMSQYSHAAPSRQYETSIISAGAQSGPEAQANKRRELLKLEDMSDALHTQAETPARARAGTATPGETIKRSDLFPYIGV